VTLARDRLEWQAEAIVRRVARGEQEAAQRALLRAPVAGFSAPGTHGRPLPPPLRAELEPQLGADLGAVRLHADPPAAAAVGAAGADAVAAGAHIYFGPHAYAPTQPSGRDLLVHELAHVLQQTATPGGALGLSARDLRGDASAQASPRAHPLAVTGGTAPEVDELILRHEVAGAADTELADAIAALRADLIARGADLPAYWDELESRLLASARPGTTIDDAVLALQVDLLKREERFGAVAELVDRFPELPTAFYDERAYTAWPDDRGYDFVFADWSELPLFAGHRPDAWLATYTTFLLGLTRPIPVFGDERPLDALVQEQYDRLAAADGRLFPNERVYAVLWAVEMLEAMRVDGLTALTVEVAGAGTAPEALHDGQRRAIAERLVDAAQGLERGEGLAELKPELQALLRAIAPQLRELAAAAVAFWADVERFADLIDLEIPDPELGAPAELLARVARREDTAAFETAIAPGLDALFTLGADAEGRRDEPLPVAEYLAARDGVLAALDPAIAAAFETPLLAERASAQPDLQLLVALGFAQALAAGLRTRLTAADATMSPDQLLEHRLQVGRIVSLLGLRFDLQRLIELGRAVEEAAREEQTQTQLALLSDWELDPSPITRIAEDVNPLEPIRGLGITADQLVDFYLVTYYEQFAAGIREQLEDLSGPDTAIQRAQAAIGPERLPQRFIVRRFDYAPSGLDTRPWGDIIRDHEKSQALLAAAVFVIFPAEPAGGVFAWTLPDLEPIVTRLKQEDAFHRLIVASRLGIPVRAVKDDAAELAVVRTLGWEEWLDAWVAASAAASAEADRARTAFGERLVAERELGLSALETTMREASSTERRHRVEQQLGPALAAYDHHHQLAEVTTPFGPLVSWDIPGRVLDELTRLVNGLGPEAERKLQESAALLELAPALLGALEGEARFDLLLAFTPRLEAALADTTNERLPLLLPLLTAYGVRDGQIADWARARAGELTQLQTALLERAKAGQREFGFQGLVEGDAQAVVGVGHSTRIEIGHAFTIDGVEWSIGMVHRSFTYHPTFGKAPPVVLLDGGEEPAQQTLLTVTRAGADKKVKADSFELLDELSRAVTMQGFVQQLGELEQLIKAATNLALDAAEFIPGAGQIVMATRLAASIFEFINSPEFDQLVDELLKDPRKAFEEVLGLVEQVFTPEKLWTWVLFGGSGAAPLRATKQAKPKPVPAGASPTLAQRVAHLVRRMIEAGRVLFQSLLRTQTRIRWRVEATQMAVLRYPLLARALRFVADNIDLIAAGIDATVELNKALDSFGERIVETAEEIANFELPLELIPPGEIIDIIVQLILARLPGKYKIAGTVLMRLLDLVGQREALFKAIADQLGPGLDPNVFWRNEVRARIAPEVQAARDEFAAVIFGVLAKIPPLNQHAAVLRAQHATLSTGPVELPDVPVSELLETEPLPAAGGPAIAPGAPVALPADGGRRLAASARHAYEARLGHDLGHVRVHDSAAAATAAQWVGARALTSGSHVYLAGDIDRPRVLAHELTHVVQQTGPRPLGSAQSDTPSRGRPGRGLSVDPRREAQAEAVAAGAGRASAAGGAHGVEPNFPEALLHAFLTNVATAVEVQSDAEKAAAATRPVKLPPTQSRRVPRKDFFESYAAAVKRMTFDHWLGRDPEVVSAIKRHLSAREEPHMAAVERGLGRVLLDSLRPESEVADTLMRRRRAKAPAAPGGPPEWVIDPARLAVALARLLFGETGVLVTIVIGRVAGSTMLLQVDSMHATYVHLPVVHGNNDLWNIALDGRLTADERPKLMPRLASTLGAEDVTSAVWDSGKFRLTDQLIADVRAAQAAAGQPKLDPSLLPHKLVYLAASDPNPIGLRRGTHTNLTKNLGPDRNSHHITQFLLLEYFSNESGNKPFPLAAAKSRVYPWLEPAGQMRPERYDYGGRQISLGSLYPGRGGDMPAISLSNPMHETEHLHLEKEEGDELLTSSHTQGGILHGFFHARLGSDYVKNEGSATDFQKYRKAKGDAAVATTVFDAIQATYAEMRRRLEPKLEHGLVAGEIPYYDKLAEAKGIPDRLTAGEMTLVAADAIARGHAMLRGEGWLA
jgi:hypothetical protein